MNEDPMLARFRTDSCCKAKPKEDELEKESDDYTEVLEGKEEVVEEEEEVDETKKAHVRNSHSLK